MTSAAEYLDKIKAKHHLPSDYAAANLIGLTRSAVSKYRSKSTDTPPDHFSPETCVRVAKGDVSDGQLGGEFEGHRVWAQCTGVARVTLICAVYYDSASVGTIAAIGG
jgi:hypothetical protein